MSYTKGELVQAALEEIGIASYEFDISPEQIDSGVSRLDAMMGSWTGLGINLSFPIAKGKNSNSDTDSNIPDSAYEAVVTNLAIRMAPSYGKAVSLDTRDIARRSYNILLKIFAQPREVQLNKMPLGAGYKASETRFTYSPKEEYLKDVDDTVDLSGGPV